MNHTNIPGFGRIRRRLGKALALTVLASAPAIHAADPVRFEIEGVGHGQFDKVTLVTKPGSQPDKKRTLCLRLGGASAENDNALLDWVKSNDAGGALASHPDATLTVLTQRKGLKKGVYQLIDISVQSFTLAADRDLTDPRLEGADLNCDAVTVAL